MFEYPGAFSLGFLEVPVFAATLYRSSLMGAREFSTLATRSFVIARALSADITSVLTIFVSASSGVYLMM